MSETVEREEGVHAQAVQERELALRFRAWVEEENRECALGIASNALPT